MNNISGGSFGGKVSPTSLLANALSVSDSVAQIILICVDKKTGDIAVGYSEGSLLQLVGLCDVAKAAILERHKKPQ
jgi:hypothetical protein